MDAPPCPHEAVGCLGVGRSLGPAGPEVAGCSVGVELEHRILVLPQSIEDILGVDAEELFDPVHGVQPSRHADLDEILSEGPMLLMT